MHHLRAVHESHLHTLLGGRCRHSAPVHLRELQRLLDLRRTMAADPPLKDLVAVNRQIDS
jgi:hypothetical protein